MNGEILTHAALPDLPTNPSMDKIREYEAALREQPNQKEFPVEHHFADGVYLRKLMLEAGDTAVGKLHKTNHLLVIAKGSIVCTTGEGMKILEAGDVIHTHPGTKRVLVALEDSVMVTVHVTTETDLAKIEAAVIQPEPKLIEGEQA